MTVTVLVWVLMTSTMYGSGMVSYSPPVATLADCQRLQDGLVSRLKDPNDRDNSKTQCIQINMVFPGAK